MDKDNEMINVKCSLCNSNMEMPKSFLSKGIHPDKINHMCSKCAERGDFDDDKMSKFTKEINEQMKKMNENNMVAEEIAEAITDSNCQSLVAELSEQKLEKEELILESFFRGAWTALFMIGNNNGSNFLKEEAKKIEDFHQKMQERENNSDN